MNSGNGPQAMVVPVRRYWLSVKYIELARFAYTYGNARVLMGLRYFILLSILLRKVVLVILASLQTILFVIFLSSCSQSQDLPQTTTSPNSTESGLHDNWLIPANRVVSGGPGKDGIPSIDDPQFSPVADIDFLQDEDLVLGIHVNGDIRAYPHPILDWHEIVNDIVDTTRVAITYCPLTGTGIGWNRRVMGTITKFGVSGLLYNSNLIPYDRDTDSNWSQILLKGVQGTQSGTDISTVHLVETTWQTWKDMFPDSRVLNLNTGFQRSYGRYPYGDFQTNHDFLIFSVDPDDDRLARKQRGLGLLVNGGSRFYNLNSFEGGRVKVIEDELAGVPLVIAGSASNNFIVAYHRSLPDGTLLSFQPSNRATANALMVDQEGNDWNLFGVAISGPRQGTSLTPVVSFMGYWFAWGAFYPGIDIYQEN